MKEIMGCARKHTAAFVPVSKSRAGGEVFQRRPSNWQDEDADERMPP
jgi:hypothetical protein